MILQAVDTILLYRIVYILLYASLWWIYYELLLSIRTIKKIPLSPAATN